jgi:Ca2+-binding RTX toxin-like protein
VLGSLAVSRVNDDLGLAFGGNAVTVAGHYASASQRVEEFVTYSSGLPYVYSAAQIEGIVTGLNTAPYAGTPIGNRAARANTTWTFQVPANTFTDTQSQNSMTYAARQVGGAALPSWLSFNATTRTLSGKPPNGTYTDFALEIVATDPQGVSATTSFILHVRPSLTTWTGTAAADSNAGTTGLDYQLGLAGNDTLSGNSGDDIQDGGDGDDTLSGQAGIDIAYGGAGNDLIDGGDGNDALNGEMGRDLLLGGLGNDTLRGGAGADTLTGGLGADILAGGDGADVYRFSAGDGTDTIDNVSSDAEVDRLDLTNLTRAQLTFARVGSDLTITRTSSSDSVRVSNWFAAPDNRIDQLVTSDGLLTTADQIDALIAGGGGVFNSAMAPKFEQTFATGTGDDEIRRIDRPVGGITADRLVDQLVSAMASFQDLGSAEAPAQSYTHAHFGREALIYGPSARIALR